MKNFRPRQKLLIRTTISYILISVIILQSITIAALGVLLYKVPRINIEQPEIELNVNLEGMASELSNPFIEIFEKISSQSITTDEITHIVRKSFYSDFVVNTVMSVLYPLLFNILTEFNLVDFAEIVDLAPTGKTLAEKIENSKYTCYDTDGKRKPLKDVLTKSGSDWAYMDNLVTWTDTNGVVRTTTLWNTINWGIYDKVSFYNAMSDMSAGLQGAIEVCIQGKSKTATINITDFLLNTDKLPLNINAAIVYNSSEKSGYTGLLMTVFNALGLKDGDYVTNEEFISYTNNADIWKAIIEPVILAFDKIADDPVNGLSNVLINFAYIIESGKLRDNLLSLKVDGDFHELANNVLGLADGEIYNLGESLIDMAGSFGIDITGSFNNFLDGILRMIFKSDYANMPYLDMDKLFSCATATTLPNGNIYYVADTQKTIDFLVEYVINEKIIESIINLTPIKGTDEAATIVNAVGQSKEGISTIAKTIIAIILEKLSPITE